MYYDYIFMVSAGIIERKLRRCQETDPIPVTTCHV